jgi:hypothetical protein
VWEQRGRKKNALVRRTGTVIDSDLSDALWGSAAVIYRISVLSGPLVSTTLHGFFAFCLCFNIPDESVLF